MKFNLSISHCYALVRIDMSQRICDWAYAHTSSGVRDPKTLSLFRMSGHVCWPLVFN